MHLWNLLPVPLSRARVEELTGTTFQRCMANAALAPPMASTAVRTRDAVRFGASSRKVSSWPSSSPRPRSPEAERGHDDALDVDRVLDDDALDAFEVDDVLGRDALDRRLATLPPRRRIACPPLARRNGFGSLLGADDTAADVPVGAATRDRCSANRRVAAASRLRARLKTACARPHSPRSSRAERLWRRRASCARGDGFVMARVAPRRCASRGSNA